MKSLKEVMKVELTEKNPCVMKADISIPAECVDNEMGIALKEFVQHAQLPGFRAGKAPKNMIRKLLSTYI